MSEEWLQEQQEKFNFARYPQLDQDKINQYLKFNEESLKEVLSEEKPNKVYILDGNKTMFLPEGKDIMMDISLKEPVFVKKWSSKI